MGKYKDIGNVLCDISYGNDNKRKAAYESCTKNINQKYNYNYNRNRNRNRNRDYDYRISRGDTILHIVISHLYGQGNTQRIFEAAQYFLENCTDLDLSLQNDEHETSLVRLIKLERHISDDNKQNCNALVQCLCEKIKDINEVHGNNRYGNTVLHLAAKNNAVVIATELLKKGASVGLKNNDGNTVLHLAAENNAVVIATALLKKGANVDLENEAGETALHLAAKNNAVDVAQVLIEKDASVDSKDGYGNTPLHFAAIRGFADAVQVLIEKGANVDLKDIYGNTPLHLAAQEDNVDAVKALIKSRASIDLKNNEGQTFWQIVLRNKKMDFIRNLDFVRIARNLDFVRNLLEDQACADAIEPFIDDKDPDGNTALHLAAQEGNVDAAKALIKSGASINLKNNKGETFWQIVLQNKKMYFVKELLEDQGCSKKIKPFINDKDTDGNTALHLAAQDNAAGAAQDNAVDAAKALIKSGASINLKNNEGQTFWQIVLQDKKMYFVKELLEDQGCSKKIKPFINSTDEAGNTALHLAAQEGDVDAAKALIKSGASINLKNNKGETFWQIVLQDQTMDFVRNLLEDQACADAIKPFIDDKDPGGNTALHLAAKRGNVDAAKALIKSGASINLKNNEGRTFWQIVLQYKKMDFVKNLLEDLECSKKIKPFIDEKDPAGNTPLHLAVDEDNVDAAKALITSGAKCEIYNRNGETVLYCAVRKSTKVLEVLIKHGADNIDINNKSTKSGDTALHLAVRLEDEEKVTLLINNGAKCNINNENGKTALSWASTHNKTELVELLKEVGYTAAPTSTDRSHIQGEAQGAHPKEPFVARHKGKILVSGIALVVAVTSTLIGLAKGGVFAKDPTIVKPIIAVLSIIGIMGFFAILCALCTKKSGIITDPRVENSLQNNPSLQ